MGSIPANRRFRADSICIIGAGPSGLAAAKYLKAERAFSRITIFEQRAGVGGLWNYVPCEDETARDQSIPQTNPHAGLDQPIWDDKSLFDKETQANVTFMSPLYDRLETNIPRGLMGFSDLDWDQDSQLFPKHAEVLEYLESYAADVQEFILFKTQVTDVSQDENQKWRVKWQEVSRQSAQALSEDTFDAVVVASGHFDIPHIPSVPGIEAWSQAYPGRISHSKFYRKPEHYSGKKVVIVGNSASGIDIGAQIQSVCQSPLIQSQKSESLFLSDSSSKVEKPPIAEYIVDGRSVKFEDGSVESDIDAILYCTGYFYSFPFLNSLQPPVVTSGQRTENLYQHIFYRPQPTLSFLVLNQKVIPFPVAEGQSAVVARVLSGRLSLPPQGVMEDWEQKTIAHYGDGKNFHVLKFPEDADYLNMLHDWAMSVDGEVKAEHSTGVKASDPTAPGKTPPRWSEQDRWTRQRFPMIKKAFQDLGDARHAVRSLEEVGYDFVKWKSEQNEQESH